MAKLGWRVGADGGTRGEVEDLVVKNSTAQSNGWKLFDNCWEGGAMKFSFTNNLVIDGFYSADNDGFGIWLDISNFDYQIKNSMSARDKGRGIFLEQNSHDGVVENNVVFSTGDATYVGCSNEGYGIATRNSNQVTIRNNTIYSTETDIESALIKSTANNHIWENNLFINRLNTGVRLDQVNVTHLNSLSMAGNYFESITASLPDNNVVACWGNSGNSKCSGDGSGLNITTLAQGTSYLEDEASECGFKVVDTSLAGIGASASFVHPRDAEVCGGGGSNTPPVTTISAPTNNQVFDLGEAISITALATDSDGIIATMEVFANEVLLGSGTSNLITETWNGASVGNHTIRVRATDNGGAFDDETITITVSDTPGAGGLGAFIETGGLVVMEAENYDDNFASSQSGDMWTLVSNFNGADAMQPGPDDNNANIANNYHLNSAELGYKINFTTTGTYYVWLRAWALSNGNSAHVGINDDPVNTGKNFQVTPVPGTAWDWEETLSGGSVAKIVVSTAGEHTFNLWMKEDGLYVDRIILTTDANYPTPSGVGPAESQRSGANQDPTVSISAPSTSDIFLVNSSITVTADASDADGSVSAVEFFADGSSIGTDATSPYSVSWTPTVDGAYDLTAVATDDQGATTTSGIVSVTIDPGGGPFIEAGGLVVMEAENFDTNTPSSQSGDVWTLIPNYNGADAMQPGPDDNNANINNNYNINSAQLDYEIDFTTTGTLLCLVESLGTFER